MDSSLPPLGEPSIHNGANQEESPMKAYINRVDFLPKAFIVEAAMICVAVLTGYKDFKLPLDSLTLAFALFLTLTYVFSFVLGLYVHYINMSEHINLTNWQYKLLVALVLFDGVCLMCTNVLLSALLNWVNALLACYLVVMLFVIGMLAYAGHQINDTNHLPRDKAFEAAIKSCCDVVYLTVGADFFMLGAVVFVYYKNPSLLVNQVLSFDLSVTFLASILGVFSMMVTALPLELFPLALRSNLLVLVNFLKYSMLFLTAAAAMTLGGRFLDGLILLALMPILVVIVAYQAKLFLAGERVNPDPENPERVDRDPNNINEESEIPGMLTNVINICIGVLSAVYPLYTGGENNGNVYLRAGIFILVSIITASLSWIAFLLNPPMNKQRAKVTKLVIGILMGLMIIIAAGFLLKIYVDLYYQTK